jgi:hypothetical protein
MPDQQLAESVVRHLEQSGFQIDEDAQALRKRPPLEPHGMARGALEVHQQPHRQQGADPDPDVGRKGRGQYSR